MAWHPDATRGSQPVGEHTCTRDFVPVEAAAAVALRFDFDPRGPADESAIRLGSFFDYCGAHWE